MVHFCSTFLIALVNLVETIYSQVIITEGVSVTHSDKKIKLEVSDISSNSALISWKIPNKRLNQLLALRLNCTRIKALVEPFIKEPHEHQLFNPSLTSQNFNATTLEPASLYECSLVGAISVNLGKEEKFVVLSETLSFKTEIEKIDRKAQLLYGNSTLKIIIGAVVPVVVVLFAIMFMFIGYRLNKKSSKNESGDESLLQETTELEEYTSDTEEDSPNPAVSDNRNNSSNIQQQLNYNYNNSFSTQQFHYENPYGGRQRYYNYSTSRPQRKYHSTTSRQKQNHNYNCSGARQQHKNFSHSMKHMYNDHYDRGGYRHYEQQPRSGYEIQELNDEDEYAETETEDNSKANCVGIYSSENDPGGGVARTSASRSTISTIGSTSTRDSSDGVCLPIVPNVQKVTYIAHDQGKQKTPPNIKTPQKLETTHGRNPTDINANRPSVSGKPPIYGRPIQNGAKPAPISGRPAPFNGRPAPISGPINGTPMAGKPATINGRPAPNAGKSAPVRGRPASINGRPDNIVRKPTDVSSDSKFTRKVSSPNIVRKQTRIQEGNEGKEEMLSFPNKEDDSRM